MTPPILARVAAQLHDSTTDSHPDTSTITTTTSWEYIPKSSSLSDLTRLGVSSPIQPLDPTPTPQPPPQQIEPPRIHNPTLPHGIVPLPPPHRHQKNPVLRSASFNVNSCTNNDSKRILPRVPRQRHAQQAIVLVAENPLNGASEVYNVPFQADIYSLPIDTVKDKQALVAHSQKQPVQVLPPPVQVLSPPVQVLPPPAQIVLPPPPPQSVFNRNDIARKSNPISNGTSESLAKPPVRWSSLSTELKENDRLPEPKLNQNGRVLNQPNLFNQKPNDKLVEQPIISSSVQSTHPKPCSSRSIEQEQSPPTPPTRKHQKPVVEPALFTKPKQLNAPHQPIVVFPKPHRTFSQFNEKPFRKPIEDSNGVPPPPTRTNSQSLQHSSVLELSRADHTNRNNTVTHELLHPPVPPKRIVSQDTPPVPPVRATTNNYSNKKPRSKSVDPEGEKRAHQHHHEPPVHLNNNMDNDEQQHLSSSSRNALGLSFLNLFRRNNNNNVRNNTNSRPHHENPTAPPQESSSSSTEPYYFRELPPPPPGGGEESPVADDEGGDSPLELKDFAASIERVKDCGWYWGPLSSEDAEELLKNEPDGSFIVRDSSDARYIFSLTFKLHGLVRHVRIEHDQGNFSFGPLTRFKANTIVDFVEKAVAHSRSGRYLFFLHRRPVLGPMQVQLLHPYSRFLHPRSLKHMCRFVILKYVRRDLIHTLPLPKPLQDYLNTPHYYFEGSSSTSGAN